MVMLIVVLIHIEKVDPVHIDVVYVLLDWVAGGDANEALGLESDVPFAADAALVRLVIAE